MTLWNSGLELGLDRIKNGITLIGAVMLPLLICVWMAILRVDGTLNFD